MKLRRFSQETQSLLSRADDQCVHLAPFPHIVIDNALDIELAEELAKTHPGRFLVDRESPTSNVRRNLGPLEIVGSSKVSDTWKRFVEYHSGVEWLNEVATILRPFLPHSLARYLAEIQSELETLKLNGDPIPSDLIDITCQISWTTPVVEASSVRGMHLDNAKKIFAGLYYLRILDDDSFGGDLQLGKWNSLIPSQVRHVVYREGVKRLHKVSEVIPYKFNNLVLFPNSVNALHAVTARTPTLHPRCFVYVSASLPNARYLKLKKKRSSIVG